MAGPAVLVSTRADDPTADLVITELNHRQVPVVRLDPGVAFPLHATLDAHLDGRGWAGEIRHGSRTLDIARVRSLYHRRPSLYAAPYLAGQDGQFAAGENRRGLGGILHALQGCRFVNHPMRVAAAEYKPVQLAAARRNGFLVPETLITSDPASAIDFAKAMGPALYKPLHAVSYDIDGEPGCVWVRAVDPADLDQTVGNAAHLFQQQIPKVADARVIVVGERVFCARITAPNDVVDWRSAYSELRYEPVALPQRLERPLRAFMAELGLLYGALDFAIDAGGVWWFLEINPNGQWAWLEPAADLPITAALADLLEKSPIS
jgi:ATP-grasp ribosomal peptide maturase